MLDGMLDSVVLPADDVGWRPWMEQFAVSVADALRRHPGIADHLEHRGNPNVHAWLMTDRDLGVLRRAGFTDDNAGTLWLSLMARSSRSCRAGCRSRRRR